MKIFLGNIKTISLSCSLGRQWIFSRRAAKSYLPGFHFSLKKKTIISVAMPYLRPMHSICVYSGAGLLRAFGGLPRALSPRRQRLRLWRGFPHLRHLFSRRDRHQSIPIDGQSNSSSPKHVWLNVLCLKHPFPKKSTNSWNYKHKCILLTQPSFHSDLLPEDNFTQPTKGCLLSCTIVTQKVHSSHLKPKLYYQQKTSPKCSPPYFAHIQKCATSALFLFFLDLFGCATPANARFELGVYFE